MLFDRNIEPNCGYCRYGANLGFGEIACAKHGIMAAHGNCSAFRYEPTKREPIVSQRPKKSEFSEDDFSLD